jgi:hypothetical protein
MANTWFQLRLWSGDVGTTCPPSEIVVVVADYINIRPTEVQEWKECSQNGGVVKMSRIGMFCFFIISN